MSLSTLCQVKTAILVTETDYPHLLDAYCDMEWDEFEAMLKSELYDYWDVTDVDNSCTRVAVVFETENIPNQQDFIKLVNSFTRLELKLKLGWQFKSEV